MAKKKATEPIIQEYEALEPFYPDNPKDNVVTQKIISIYNLCYDKLKLATQVPIKSGNGTDAKNYIYFEINGKKSRPVNIDLYNDGCSLVNPNTSKVQEFLHNLETNNITHQSAEDITASIYVIAIGFCCCIDIIKGGHGRKIAGTFFERFVGHLYAKHLNLNPSRQMLSCNLDGSEIRIPTDYIFDPGIKKPKLHIPVKTSTRDRVVQVWAQQRVLDGAYGMGRFLCLLTCLCETEYVEDSNKVNDVCVPDQWINYQLFIAHMKRAYYLDMPGRYKELNYGFPKIYVKSFGEFFHESGQLFD